MLQIWFIGSEMTEIPGGPHVCENFLTPGGIGALTEAHNQSLEVQCCSYFSHCPGKITKQHSNHFDCSSKKTLVRSKIHKMEHQKE